MASLTDLQDSNAQVSLSPHAIATRPDRRVPRDQVGNSDAVLWCNDRTGLSRFDKVEALAFGCHAGLNWRRRLDAIARVGRGSAASNNPNAGVSICPESAAVAASPLVPSEEVSESDALA